MKYSNDVSDRKKRKINFYLYVIILPVFSIILICIFTFFLARKSYITKADSGLSYAFSITAGIIIYGLSKKNWLKMPDGTYYNIKKIRQKNKATLDEPVEYEEEFFYSKKVNILVFLIGLILVGAGILFSVKQKESILLPIGTITLSLLLIYTSSKNLLYKTAALKFAKKGLWTKKLGFVDWNDLINAQVIEEVNGNSTQLILEIYLKGTIHAQANEADESIYLSSIANNQFIEIVIENLITNRNKLD